MQTSKELKACSVRAALPGMCCAHASGSPRGLYWALLRLCGAFFAAELMTKAGAKGIPHAFIIDVNNAITYSGHPRDPGFEAALNKAAAAAAPKREPEALPLITESKEELMSRSIKELKGMLSERGVSMAGLAEKADLVGKIMEACSTVTYYK